MLYRGEARQTLPPIQEWRRFDAADVQPGLFWCEADWPPFPAEQDNSKADSPPSWQSTLLCRAAFLTLPPSLSPFSAARSEAQTLKGRDRKRATQADLHFAMAKQYMMPLLRRLTNLRTEVATGRTRNHYGVAGASSRARSSLGGRRKSRGWNGGLGGRKKRPFGVRLPGTAPARHS